MYTRFYNFSAKPFNLHPDPQFLYFTPSHREALASMIYGIKEQRGFISLTGEVGTGKTTLIYSLIDNLDEKVKIAFFFHTSNTFEQLLSHILMDLNVTVDSDEKVTLLYKLNEYLIHHISPDETLVVIIDEAQNLPLHVMEEFRLLSNMETSKQKLLQIILVGQPELQAKLNRHELRQLKQRIGIRCIIKPLSSQESKEYIDHRLKLVGSSCDAIFNADALSLICNYARGIPRVINILCDNALVMAYGRSQQKITARIVNEVIANLTASVEETQEPPPRAAAIPVTEKSFPRSVFYLLCLIIFVLLAALAVSLRGLFRQETAPQHVVQLAEPEPAQTIPSQEPLPSALAEPPLESPGEPSLDNPAEPPLDSPGEPSLESSGEPSLDNPAEPPLESPGKPSLESPAEPPPDSPVEPSLESPAEPPPNTAGDRTLSNPAEPAEQKPGLPEGKPVKMVALDAGGSLYALSLENYQRANPTLYDLILKANPDILNIRRIPDTKKIIVPEITPESFIEMADDNNYLIHVGTFQSRSVAALCAARLDTLLKQPSSVDARNYSSVDTWYRVTVGNFASREDALDAVDRLIGARIITLP